MKKDIGYLGKGHNKLNGIIDVATMQSLKNDPDIIIEKLFFCNCWWVSSYSSNYLWTNY